MRLSIACRWLHNRQESILNEPVHRCPDMLDRASGALRNSRLARPADAFIVRMVSEYQMHETHLAFIRGIIKYPRHNLDAHVALSSLRGGFALSYHDSTEPQSVLANPSSRWS
jgi:hypothetical protein